MNSENVCKKINELSGNIDETDNDIDSQVDKLNEIFRTSLEFKKFRTRTKKMEKPPHKKWYDKSCYEVKKRLKLISQLLTKSPKNPLLRGSFMKTKKKSTKNF